MQFPGQRQMDFRERVSGGRFGVVSQVIRACEKPANAHVSKFLALL